MNQRQKSIRRALDQAIEFCDSSQSELSRRADVSIQTINNAYRRGSVSPDLAEALEKAVDGKISRATFVWGDLKEAA